MGRSKITCCMNCTDRYVGCHGSCEKYIKEVEKNNAEREAIRKAKPIVYKHEASVNRVRRSSCVYKKNVTHRAVGGKATI